MHMTQFHSKHQLILIIVIGALLIIPWGVFVGVMFTFTFRNHESIWAWIFDLLTFWCQVLGVIVSFVKPRAAAIWMLTALTASASLAITYEVRDTYASSARHIIASQWITVLPSILKAAFFLYGIPLLFALLVLRVTRPKNT